MTAVFIALGAIGLIAMCCLIAYDEGHRRALADADGMFEVAKALGAYGHMLRTEAEAVGSTVEEILARDTRAAAERRGDVAVELVVKEAQRVGFGNALRAWRQGGAA